MPGKRQDPLLLKRQVLTALEDTLFFQLYAEEQLKVFSQPKLI
jgi:hypothetical protein